MLNDFLDLAVYNLIINKTIIRAIIMDKVILKQEKVTIPTYEISDYKNPMFLEKRVSRFKRTSLSAPCMRGCFGH